MAPETEIYSKYLLVRMYAGVFYIPIAGFMLLLFRGRLAEEATIITCLLAIEFLIIFRYPQIFICPDGTMIEKSFFRLRHQEINLLNVKSITYRIHSASGRPVDIKQKLILTDNQGCRFKLYYELYKNNSLMFYSIASSAKVSGAACDEKTNNILSSALKEHHQ